MTSSNKTILNTKKANSNSEEAEFRYLIFGIQNNFFEKRFLNEHDYFDTKKVFQKWKTQKK
jgi:hypothetical protein